MRPCFRRGPGSVAESHRRWSGPAGTRCTIDNQAELLPRVLQERRRRAAYANCDRAPLGWETRNG